MNIPRCTFFLVLAAMSTLCHAQDNPPVQLNLPVERARITQQRADFEATFAQKQQHCYQRFAVSDCLGKARGERRVALDELRRQEIQLNSLERQAKALAELDRIQSNFSPERRQELELQRQQALLDAQERQLRSEEKKAGAARPAVSAASVADSVSPARAPVDAVVQQQRFSEKLQEAQQRKADKAKSLIERGAGSATSLPIPAAQ